MSVVTYSVAPRSKLEGANERATQTKRSRHRSATDEGDTSSRAVESVERICGGAGVVSMRTTLLLWRAKSAQTTTSTAYTANAACSTRLCDRTGRSGSTRNG